MALAQITIRRGTTAEWAAANPVLGDGEMGYDSTLKRVKVGDGVVSWVGLGWSTMSPGEVQSVLTAATIIDQADTPTDASVANLITTPGSQTNTQLSTAIAEAAGNEWLLLHAGPPAAQSNVAGRGTPYSAVTDPENELIFQFGYKTRTLRKATEPLDMNEGGTPGIGPMFQFARQLIARGLNGGRRILIIPSARGGTQLSKDTAATWRSSVRDSLWDNWVRLRADAIAAIEARGETWIDFAAISIQGESDGDQNVSGATYQADHDANIVAMRAIVGDDMPLLVGGMVPEYLNTGTRAAINAVHATVAERHRAVAFVPAPLNRNKGDGNHFSRQGEVEIAANMADAFAKLYAGLPYDSGYSAPAGQVTGVAIGAVAGTSVSLTWTAPVNAVSYRVEYRAVGAASWTAGPQPTTTAATVSGLTPVTQYEFRVTARNGAGVDSAPSAAVSATTAAPSFRAFTSDGFSGSGVLAGRTTDAFDGGSPAGYATPGPSDRGTVSGGKLVPGSGSGVWGQFLLPDPRGRVELTFDALPTAGFVYLSARTSNVSGAGGYRLAVGSTSMQLESNGAVIASAIPITAPASVALDVNGTAIRVLVNGSEVANVTDSVTSAAGYAGIGLGSTAVGFVCDALKVSTVF
ncbi:sialate O-acetylesterase [Microbacterium plantarum]|uniref:sialate O-acetylesterase n=1 Tax=Microbacterium plantarum TaxID=1816425 RepID=UPI002B4A8F4D|nr:sialate O-acetylesterase [Microbacterium plantarum]WRK16487.1 sialate O-acetylesterase [Microbacterium plantarum]